VLGTAGALAAQVFTWLLRGSTWLFLGKLAGYRPPGLPSDGGLAQELIGPYGVWLVPLATTLGGLLVGLLIAKVAPEAEGHGTDTVVRAFHRAGGFLRGRVAPVKVLASAITIGSGGSAGREGPIALTAAGIGSWYAGLTGRSEGERRLLLLTGMAAGLAAIFRSPVGTALFAIEVLYADMEFESSALLYTMLASIVAYAINGLFVGWQPLFRISTPLALPSPWSNAWYLVLGVAAGVLGTYVPLVFYRIRDVFRALPVHPALKPALGGLLMGALALVVPDVIGGGYGWMQAAIDGRLALGTLAILALAKPLALSLSVASGGSGGVFAPSLFAGGMLGGLLAGLVHLPAAPFVVVGMAAMFAGAARVPIATLVMVTEMTGGYTLLVPAALAVMLSYLVQRLLAARVRYRSLYEGQVGNRADSPAHHSEHLRIALRILKDRQVLNPAEVGQLDLVSLMRSGIPVELPGERRLTIGVLRPESTFVGQPLGAEEVSLTGDTSVIGIIRGERMLPPRPDTTLEAGDRLILLTTRTALERLRPHLDKW
jgi:CIC family chloride channel protein